MAAYDSDGRNRGTQTFSMNRDELAAHLKALSQRPGRWRQGTTCDHLPDEHDTEIEDTAFDNLNDQPTSD